MNLLSIARKLWRYKLLTLPVVLLTLCGAVYVVAVKEPVYEASSSYILINPPLPPTPEDIARNPALGRVNADNPYTRFSDQTVVVEVLASAMATKSAERALLKAGADPRYKVEPAGAFGFSSPIVKITAQGATPEAAIDSAKLVGNQVTGQLARMQQAEGVDPDYRIKANQVDAPDGAELRASGQLRMLVGVLAIGTILLFVTVSLADALTMLRRERLGGPAPSWLPGSDGTWPARDGRSDGEPGLGPRLRSDLDDEPVGGEPLISLFPDGHPDATATHGSLARQRGQRKRRGLSG
jgi:hypothetical protein